MLGHFSKPARMSKTNADASYSALSFLRNIQHFNISNKMTISSHYTAHKNNCGAK